MQTCPKCYKALCFGEFLAFEFFGTAHSSSETERKILFPEAFNVFHQTSLMYKETSFTSQCATTCKLSSTRPETAQSLLFFSHLFLGKKIE